MLGGLTVIGSSLPPGDPYVLQVVHHIATDYVAGRERGGSLWPQRRLKVVDLQTDEQGRRTIIERFRFFDRDHTDIIFDGFSSTTLPRIINDDVAEPGG